MSMRIENQNDLSAVGNARSSATQSVGQESRGASATGTSRSNGDQVDLSSASSLVDAAKNSVSTDRAARIARLTQQVQSGTYKIDPSQISRAMVQSQSQN